MSCAADASHHHYTRHNKFTYVAYSPVTSPPDAAVTCPEDVTLTCPPGCHCMTSELPTSGLTCLDVGDQLRHGVD